MLDSPGLEKATDLSVMILGFTVTTSVFTPTSMMYFSEIGGRLHLQKDRRHKVKSLSMVLGSR